MPVREAALLQGQGPQRRGGLAQQPEEGRGEQVHQAVPAEVQHLQVGGVGAVRQEGHVHVVQGAVAQVQHSQRSPEGAAGRAGNSAVRAGPAGALGATHTLP